MKNSIIEILLTGDEGVDAIATFSDGKGRVATCIIKPVEMP